MIELMTRWLNRWISIGLVVILGIYLGMLSYSLFDKRPLTVKPVHWASSTQWLVAEKPSHQLYIRKTFQLSEQPQAAWLQISGDQLFKCYVNGTLVVQESPNLFESIADQSIAGVEQRLNNGLPYRLQEDPANYQTTRPNNWKLVLYVDLTGYLQPGRNAIAVVVEESQMHPRLAMQGVVYPTPDRSQSLGLTTGATEWKASTMVDNWQQLQWFDRDFPDQDWPIAITSGSIQRQTFSSLSSQIFDRFLQGTWISGPESNKGEVWLRGTWYVRSEQHRSFIRFAGIESYAVTLNNQLINQYGSDANELHMYEVTNILKPGLNTFAISLKRPFNLDTTTSQQAPLGFFLDGWVETKTGEVHSAIATDTSWEAIENPISDWAKGAGSSQPAFQLAPVRPASFQRFYEGDAYLTNYVDHLQHQSLWFLVSVTMVLGIAWSLGRFWVGIRTNKWQQISAGTSLLLPGTLFLMGMGLLNHRYALEETGLLFVQDTSKLLLLLIFVLVVCCTLLWSSLNTKHESSPTMGIPSPVVLSVWFLWGCMASLIFGIAQQGQSGASVSSLLGWAGAFSAIGLSVWFGFFYHWKPITWTQVTPPWVHKWAIGLLLAAITSLGLFLRLYHLEDVIMVPDEATSYDTASSILRTGIPLSTSGIWYTRSPVYHYSLALWMYFMGNTTTDARQFSAVWGALGIVIFFFFARYITQKPWLALFMAAILALDPWQITTSRIIRFYQPVQSLSLLVFLLFFQGYVRREGKLYQSLFFVVLTLTLLSQEVTVIFLPSFLIGFLCFYRPFNLRKDWHIIAGSIMTVAILLVDLIVFEIKCKTPAIALSTTTAPMVQPHFFDVTDFSLSLLAGPGRIFVLYGFFCLLGILYFLNNKSGELIFLFFSIATSTVLLTILVMEVRNRYLYPVYPLFLLVAFYSAVCILQSVGEKFEKNIRGLVPLKEIALGALMLLMIGNLKLGDIALGYQEPLFLKQDQALAYIQEHRQPEDAVMAGSAQIAAIMLDKLDYFAATGVLRFDIYYRPDGLVVDRWAKGQLVSNLDQLNRILAKNQRLWIMLSDTDPSVPPTYQAFQGSLNTLGKPVLDTYGVQVRLWTPEDGYLPSFPNTGQDIGSY